MKYTQLVEEPFPVALMDPMGEKILCREDQDTVVSSMAFNIIISYFCKFHEARMGSQMLCRKAKGG